MRRVGLFALLSLLSFAGAARAQTAPPANQKDPNNSQFDLRRYDTSVADGDTARAKARAGDCAGALAAFDRAIEKSSDPTLRRDRGLCHEKLGDVYPALDDLRAYITARPDAPDADQMRQKVNALEAGTTNEQELLESNDRRRTTAATEDSLDVYEKEDPSQRKKNEPFGARPGEKEHSYEYYKEQERLDDEAASSPLRNGHGFILGGWGQFPREYLLGHANGIGWAAGGSFRWAFNKTWTIHFDLGYMGIGVFRSVPSEPLYQTTSSGPLLALGGEIRVPFDRRGGNHFIFRFGAGYERPVATTSNVYTNMVLGRFALGYRHVFGQAFGMEFLADGGPALAVIEGGEKIGGAVVGFHFGLDFGI